MTEKKKSNVTKNVNPEEHFPDTPAKSSSGVVQVKRWREEKQTQEWSSKWEGTGSLPCNTHTLTHHINSRTCQGCRHTCQSLSSKDRFLNATRLRVSVVLKLEENWICSFYVLLQCFIRSFFRTAVSLRLSDYTKIWSWQRRVEPSSPRMSLFIHLFVIAQSRKINMRWGKALNGSDIT